VPRYCIIHISQPPRANALGRIRLQFPFLPEQVSVYQHEPRTSIRSPRKNARSIHAAMRVRSDHTAATLLNSPCRTITTARENFAACMAAARSTTSNPDLPTPIPVNTHLQTALVDDAGRLQIRKDVYGRDSPATILAVACATPETRTWRTLVAAHFEPSYVVSSSRPSVCGWLNFCSANTLRRRAPRFLPGPRFFERLFGARARPVAPGRRLVAGRADKKKKRIGPGPAIVARFSAYCAARIPSKITASST